MDSLHARKQEGLIVSLSFKEYQENTQLTAVYRGKGTINGLFYVSLGLGEVGEIQGKVKKIWRDDNGIITPEKKQAIAGEIGDVLWYISQMCTELGIEMDAVAESNLKKLQDRMNRGTISGSGDNR